MVRKCSHVEQCIVLSACDDICNNCGEFHVRGLVRAESVTRRLETDADAQACWRDWARAEEQPINQFKGWRVVKEY